MSNYYKQFLKFVESEKLKGTKMPLDVFEHKIRINFGLGSRKGLLKWINNFKEMGYISIHRDDEGNWQVSFL